MAVQHAAGHAAELCGRPGARQPVCQCAGRLRRRTHLHTLPLCHPPRPVHPSLPPSWPQVAELTWAETFKYLADNKVLFEGILLKPSMVTPGAEHAKKATPEEVSCPCFGVPMFRGFRVQGSEGLV